MNTSDGLDSPPPHAWRMNMDKTTHPAHDCLRASAFLNRQLLKLNETKVTLEYKTARSSEEDDDDSYFDYTLIRKDDGRCISILDFKSSWRKPQTGPKEVDWEAIDLRIYPQENNELGMERKIRLNLYGLENVSGLRVQTPTVWAWLFSPYKDQGLFACKSPVVLEFKRRLSCENAYRRIEEANKTLAKHRAIQPFVTD